MQEINQINSVIIQSLHKCLRPYLYDSKFSLINDKNEYEFIPKDDICYQDEILNYSFIQKGKKNNKVEIEFTSTVNEKLVKENLVFDDEKIINIPNGEILSKIIIGNILKNKNISKEEEIELSKKYQILSKNTSLFAEISGNEPKIIGTLKNIKLKTYSRKYEDYNYYKYDKKSSREEFHDLEECAIGDEENWLDGDECAYSDEDDIVYNAPMGEKMCYKDKMCDEMSYDKFEPNCNNMCLKETIPKVEEEKLMMKDNEIKKLL